jgi:hypothetical protein
MTAETSASTRTSTAPVAEGDVLDGKYRVERVLGEGGMGVVVAARHLQLEQRVAIKFVLPHAVGNAEAMERFAREARAAVKLRSHHVARVLDVGTLANGAPYMVMEYLEGGDLGALIETNGPLDAVVAVDLVLQACEAIAEAHANGIVHRDLKPQNLFVTQSVQGKPLVMVLDFGISKQMATEGAELSLTRTATVMGSPNYMSPEQLRSAKLVDVRTDIWALGVILYEALTGRVPFVAETVTQLTAMVLQDAPRPISELRADLPPGLSRVIERCLAKAPGDRFGSVAELAQALDGFGSVPGAARRIAEVTGSLGRVPLAIGSSAGQLASGGTGSTSVAWGETQLATPGKSRAALVAMAFGLVTIVVLVAAVTFAVRALRPSAAASVPPVEVVPTTRQIDLAAPAPSIAPAASAPPPAAPPLAPPPVASAPSAPPSPVAAPTGRAPAPRPRPAAPPKPGKPSDDMPNERN